jgi:GDP-L-fucose synthase
MTILVTGGTGFLGQHVVQELKKGKHIIFPFGSKNYNLTKYEEVESMLKNIKPEIVINLAANVGGIQYNLDNSYDLFHDNILINFNLIDCCRSFNVKRFIQIGTTCSYPAIGHIPFAEEEFWNGYPDKSNAPYGIAKKVSLVQLQESGLNWVYLVLANLYGPGDNFEPEKSHVIPALIRKFVNAKNKNHPYVTVWGIGEITRDFLYVEDAAKCIAKCVDLCDNNIMYNVGSGIQISIKMLAQIIKKLTDYQGEIVWDITKPEGQRVRQLDITKISNIWQPTTNLKDGLEKTIEFYKENYVTN